jgi:hypothetical protein
MSNLHERRKPAKGQVPIAIGRKLFAPYTYVFCMLQKFFYLSADRQDSPQQIPARCPFEMSNLIPGMGRPSKDKRKGITRTLRAQLHDTLRRNHQSTTISSGNPNKIPGSGIICTYFSFSDSLQAPG